MAVSYRLMCELFNVEYIRKYERLEPVNDVNDQYISYHVTWRELYVGQLVN